MANQIMQYFVYSHLREGPLREVSKIVCEMAGDIDQLMPDCAEKSAGLRKLLEAKDCFVRAAIAEDA